MAMQRGAEHVTACQLSRKAGVLTFLTAVRPPGYNRIERVLLCYGPCLAPRGFGAMLQQTLMGHAQGDMHPSDEPDCADSELKDSSSGILRPRCLT